MDSTQSLMNSGFVDGFVMLDEIGFLGFASLLNLRVLLHFPRSETEPVLVIGRRHTPTGLRGSKGRACCRLCGPNGGRCVAMTLYYRILVW